MIGFTLVLSAVRFSSVGLKKDDLADPSTLRDHCRRIANTQLRADLTLEVGIVPTRSQEQAIPI